MNARTKTWRLSSWSWTEPVRKQIANNIKKSLTKGQVWLQQCMKTAKQVESWTNKSERKERQARKNKWSRTVRQAQALEVWKSIDIKKIIAGWLKAMLLTVPVSCSHIHTAQKETLKTFSTHCSCLLFSHCLPVNTPVQWIKCVFRDLMSVLSEYSY